MIWTVIAWINKDANKWADSIWCRLGLHSWLYPSAPCKECGWSDRLFTETVDTEGEG